MLRCSRVPLSLLLGALAVLQGLMFPAIVALQARWIPNARASETISLEDIWASRTLGIGGFLSETIVAGAIMVMAAQRGVETAASSMGALLLATSGVTALCVLRCPPYVPTAATPARAADSMAARVTQSPNAPQPMPLGALLSKSAIARATILAASAAGAALGMAQQFLPAPVVSRGIVLVYFVDIALGFIEAILRSLCVPVRNIRRGASTLAPLLAAAGMVALIPIYQPQLRALLAWPVAPMVLLFVQAPIGFGVGFGCGYRELGRRSDSATLAALGSVAVCLRCN